MGSLPDFRIALLAGAVWLGFATATQAASFTVPPGATDTTPKTVDGGDTGTIGAGATLTSANPITWSLTAADTDPAVINNFGTVTGTASAIVSGGSGTPRSFTLNNSGAVTGQLGAAISINSGSPANVVTINNSAGATITGTSSGGTIGDGIDVAQLVNLTNSGTINTAGTYNFFAGVPVGLSIGGGSVVNNAGGVITSSTGPSILVGNVGGAVGAVTIDNAGTMYGVSTAGRYTIMMTSSFDNTLINRATGVIGGGVLMGSGNDTAILYAGSSLTGVLDGGAGNNTLILTGSGNGSLGSSSPPGGGAANFQTLDVQGGTWTAVVSSATVNITIAPGASLETGILAGPVTDNGTLIFDAGGTQTYAPTISGSGNLGVQVAGGRSSGDFILSGNNSYTGTTTITGATVSATNLNALGNGGAVSLANATLDISAAAGTFNHLLTITGQDGLNAAGQSWAGAISGTGYLVVSGQAIFTANNSYSGGTQIASGAQLVLAGPAGMIQGQVQDVGDLTFDRSDAATFSGTIFYTGTVHQNGSGTLTFTNANTYTGGTVIASGSTLQLGAGGTSGSIAGNVSDTGTLAFDRSDATSFAGIISGSGGVNQMAGNLTLSGVNTYTGMTTVSGGTLNVTGSVAGPVGVSSGATLTGTGTVGTTTVASGATVTPGSSFSVNGNLALASGANFVEALTPTAANLTTVSGSAGLGGTLSASFAAGTYTVGKKYTLLTATGGVTGTFASLVVTAPVYVRPTLSYDANDVFLTLNPASLAASLSNGSNNQKAVASALDAAVTAGYVPAGGALALYNLSGSALNGAIDQISGQLNSNTASAVGESFLSFLTLMTPGEDADPARFAPGQAYGGDGAPARAQLAPGQSRVWGMVYGGTADLDGNAASGAAGLSASNVGFAVGVDARVETNLLAGVTLGVGHQNFSSGNGTGNSDDVMLGGYVRESIGNAYFAGSLAYGWHSIATSRTVTISGTDVLDGNFNATDLGGRIEAGWDIPLQGVALTPYGAWTLTSFEAPAYAERAGSGASTFALSYAGHSTAVGRTELGARLGGDLGDVDGHALAASVSAAWAHQLDDTPFLQAAFTGIPGANFQVVGTHAGANTALLGGDLKAQAGDGLNYGVRLESQLGQGTTIFEGMGTLGWRW